MVFPAGANVEFSASGAPPTGVDLYERMRVYERGAGETLSCGSGAVAVAAVALRQAGSDLGSVAVDVPGGRLTVTFRPGSLLADRPGRGRGRWGRSTLARLADLLPRHDRAWPAAVRRAPVGDWARAGNASMAASRKMPR